ncbi:response regulator transcription factor [Magnetospira thiophila]
MRLLVVEDDPAMMRQLRLALEGAGYVVDTALDGEEGHFLGDTEPYDAVVLDLGLPKRSGLSVLEQWRQDGHALPVLILSARDSWREKVTGLRSGADDYLAKPFEMEELLARIEVLVRRGAGQSQSILSCGGLRLDAAAGRITLDAAPLSLTALEYRLLAYLIHHAEKVISKTELTEHIYAYDGDRDSNTIEVLINRLRKKIGNAYVHTHRGRGYQLTAPHDPA